MAEPAQMCNGLLIVVTSNRGLCGAFNSNVIRAARRWTEAERKRFRILRAAFLDEHVDLRPHPEGRQVERRLH